MISGATAVLLGWGAVGIGLASTYLQFRRIRQRGHEGVSLATWVLFLFMGIFWMTYGATRRSPEIIMGSAVIFPLQFAIVVRLAPWRHAVVVLRALGYFAALCVVPTLIWGWIGGLVGVGFAMTINRGPQIVELIRHRDASGVSVASWLYGVLGSVLWMLFYVKGHLYGAIAATAFAGLTNATVAGLAAWRDAQTRSTAFERQSVELWL